MSGPKSSRYTLTAEQRRILAEQRRIEQETQICRAKLRQYFADAQQLPLKLENETKKSKEILARIGSDGGLAVQMNALENAVRIVSTKSAVSDSSSLETLKEVCIDVSLALTDAKNIAEKIHQILLENDKKLSDSISCDIDRAFSEIRLTTNKQDQEKTRILEKLDSVLHDVTLSSGLSSRVNLAKKNVGEIADSLYLHNFDSLTVVPLVKECNDYLVEYKAINSQYLELRAKYEALCASINRIPENTECSRSAITFFEKQIAFIESKLAEDDEKAYISQCMDEVMAEMGYRVLGHREIKKKNGTQFTNELYSYSDGTAVNVTYAADGRITMELGGIDTIDRLPEKYECASLCESMEDFCEDFSEIERRLAAKGVVVRNRISILPPLTEYAQIINTTDYQMSAAVEGIEVQRKRKHHGKTRTAHKEL